MRLVEKICKELGINIREEWQSNTGKVYTITEDGVFFEKTPQGWDHCSNYDYSKLLKGDLKPVWKPKTGETCFRVSFDYKAKYYAFDWDNLPGQERAYSMGIVFKTREEAIETADKMLKVVESNE